MRLSQTFALSAALVCFVFNGTAEAARPRNEQANHQRPQARANRVALFANGEAVCQTSLIEYPQLRPRFVQLDDSTTETDDGSLGGLRSCEGPELTSLAQMADLANSSNQVAGLPLFVVPALVCIAGLAGGAWAAHEALDLRMQSTGPFLYSVWGATAAAQALAMMMAGFNAPATNVAVAGGVFGAACGVFGTLSGTLYFSWPR